MIWDIIDYVGMDDGIIQPECREGKIITWDFAGGSRFELCALFPRLGGETLEDFKKEGKRPILYHKNLRLYYKVPENDCTYCYCLYPAIIKDNVLLIGNQKNGNHVYLKPKEENIEIFEEIEFSRKFLFFFQKKYLQEEKYCIKFAESKRQNTIYYKVSNRQNSKVYSMSLVYGSASIYLHADDKITFYMDKNCMKELEKEKI